MIERLLLLTKVKNEEPFLKTFFPKTIQHAQPQDIPHIMPHIRNRHISFTSHTLHRQSTCQQGCLKLLPQFNTLNQHEETRDQDNHREPSSRKRSRSQRRSVASVSSNLVGFGIGWEWHSVFCEISCHRIELLRLNQSYYGYKG